VNPSPRADKNKRIVVTSRRRIFEITEDNQEQKIAFYSKEVALPIRWRYCGYFRK